MLLLLISCNNSGNEHNKEFSSQEDAVNFAVSSLRKMDVENQFPLYHVVEDKQGILFIINTNKDNRLTFMCFFDTIDCKPIKKLNI